MGDSCQRPGRLGGAHPGTWQSNVMHTTLVTIAAQTIVIRRQNR